MAKITELNWEPHITGGKRAVVEFPNGYSASCLSGGLFYTEGGTYEIGVIHDGELDYDNPVTNGDVLGYLSAEEADKALADIEALPPKPKAA